MRETLHELVRRLGENAEAVCRHYLSNGRRQGRYWTVGDVRNTPGRSMYVRLAPSASGPAGRWVDGATAEYGDLLDVIWESCGFADFRDVVDEARRFLSLSPAEPHSSTNRMGAFVATGSPEAARRLFAMSQPIAGTLAETYLRERGIATLHGTGSLRFHPRCFYKPDEHSPTETWPAMIAAVTDLSGTITGVHRTYLDPFGLSPDGCGKAPIAMQRKAMGKLLGHAVRFGVPGRVMAVGEGIETTLSLRCALPGMAMAAALSAAHLAAIFFPPPLRRLYVICDNDPAGEGARDTLIERAGKAGIEAIVLSPQGQDFNDDLRICGLKTLRASIADQLMRRDRSRYLKRTA